MGGELGWREPGNEARRGGGGGVGRVRVEGVRMERAWERG